MAIVEVNNYTIEGVVVKDKDGYKNIPIDEFLKPITDRVKSLEDKLNTAENTIRNYAEIEKSVKTYISKFDNDKAKANLIRFMAFENLNDDINYNGIDYPSNYNEIKAYVYEPEGKEIPQGFDKYLKQITGESESSKEEEQA